MELWDDWIHSFCERDLFIEVELSDMPRAGIQSHVIVFLFEKSYVLLFEDN